MADPVTQLAINAALIATNVALTASQHFEGPRLDELSVTTADYGAALNYIHGIRRLDGVPCMWAEPLTEVKRRRKTKGGKFNDYTYYATWANVVCDHEVQAITRIWFDRNLVYDATGAGPISPFSTLGDITQFMRIYLGTDDQDVDPRMSATIDAQFGAGSTPAFRGVTYIVFEDLPVEKLGNRMPQVTVEVQTAGSPAYPVEIFTAATNSMYNGWALTYSPDRSRVMWGMDGDYEIWDVGARALMVSGAIPDYHGTQSLFGIANDGTLYCIGLPGSPPAMTLLRLAPDGLSTQLTFTATAADYATVLVDGAGVEWVCITSWSTYNDGYLHPHVELILQPVLLDTLASTGLAWQIKFFCADARGDIWAFGSYGGVAANVLAIWRVVNGSGSGGIDYHFVTMPSSQVGGIAYVAAWHCLTTTVDQFVIAWGGPGATKYLVTVDCTTWAVNDTRAYSLDPYNTVPQFRATDPGAASAWISDGTGTAGGLQLSGEDLTTLRSVSYTSFGYPGLIAPGMIYDARLHAFLTSLTSTTFAWMYLDRVGSSGVTLRTVVEDVSTRAGLSLSEFDATDLTQILDGYSWTQGTGKAILDPLLEAYDSEACPHDFGLVFSRRGAASLGTIAVADMGAGGAIRYDITTILDTDLPLKASLTFADLAADQQPNTALAQRAAAATDTRRELSLDQTTLALSAGTARIMVDGYLRRTWMKGQEINLSLARGWMTLEPGDTYTLSLDDVDRVAKLKRLEFGANGVLTTQWERYAPAIHGNTSLAGAPADGLGSTAIVAFGYTRGLVLDIPLVLDAHDTTSPPVYLAAGPYSTAVAWPGATFYRSDDGIDYSDTIGDVASSERATIGTALSALPSALYTVWDRVSTVSVQLFDGTLTSATEAEVANGANMALLGDEMLRFTTATLIAPMTYQLSGFLRGRRGTEWAVGTHATGDVFVLLSGLPRAAMGASDVGDTIYARPTTSGGPDGFPQTLAPYSGASLKPYAVAHLQVRFIAGDWVGTWVRRTRIGGAWHDYQDVSLGEGSEAYVGQILNGAGAVIRTISGLSTPTVTYTAAMVSADGGLGVTLRVMQVSATVGNGFAADVALG